jgi:hypothetical protein
MLAAWGRTAQQISDTNSVPYKNDTCYTSVSCSGPAFPTNPSVHQKHHTALVKHTHTRAHARTHTDCKHTFDISRCQPQTEPQPQVLNTLSAHSFITSYLYSGQLQTSPRRLTLSGIVKLVMTDRQTPSCNNISTVSCAIADMDLVAGTVIGGRKWVDRSGQKKVKEKWTSVDILTHTYIYMKHFDSHITELRMLQYLHNLILQFICMTYEVFRGVNTNTVVIWVIRPV